MPATMGSHYQKYYVAPHFDCLDLRNAIVPLIIRWQHMMPVPVPMASHEHKCHVAPYFSCPGLMNAVMLLAMSFVSCDANTCT